MQPYSSAIAEDTETEYRAIEATLLETVRGRWFLAEHGRRARRLDGALLEDAIRRLQASLREPPALLGQLKSEIETVKARLAETRAELMARPTVDESMLPTHAILMVSVPDPSGPAFPREARGFGSPPAAIAGRRLVAVRSSDDPYAGAAMDAQVVAGWNAEPVSVGARGHVNAASGLGAWPEGWAIVERWRAE